MNEFKRVSLRGKVQFFKLAFHIVKVILALKDKELYKQVRRIRPLSKLQIRIVQSFREEIVKQRSSLFVGNLSRKILDDIE